MKDTMVKYSRGILLFSLVCFSRDIVTADINNGCPRRKLTRSVRSFVVSRSVRIQVHQGIFFGVP